MSLTLIIRTNIVDSVANRIKIASEYAGITITSQDYMDWHRTQREYHNALVAVHTSDDVEAADRAAYEAWKKLSSDDAVSVLSALFNDPFTSGEIMMVFGGMNWIRGFLGGLDYDPNEGGTDDACDIRDILMEVSPDLYRVLSLNGGITRVSWCF
jgi:hypothetical protein